MTASGADDFLYLSSVTYSCYIYYQEFASVFQDLVELEEPYWGTPDNSAPSDMPTCGYLGELCQEDSMYMFCLCKTIARIYHTLHISFMFCGELCLSDWFTQECKCLQPNFNFNYRDGQINNWNEAKIKVLFSKRVLDHYSNHIFKTPTTNLQMYGNAKPLQREKNGFAKNNKT